MQDWAQLPRLLQQRKMLPLLQNSSWQIVEYSVAGRFGGIAMRRSSPLHLSPDQFVDASLNKASEEGWSEVGRGRNWVRKAWERGEWWQWHTVGSQPLFCSLPAPFFTLDTPAKAQIRGDPLQSGRLMKRSRDIALQCPKTYNTLQSITIAHLLDIVCSFLVRLHRRSMRENRIELLGSLTLWIF